MPIRHRALLAALTAALVASSAHAQKPPEPIKVKVIGFNDCHGNLQPPGKFGINTTVPVAQRPAVGGAEYIAAHAAKLKQQNPLNVVVGAGDLGGASPLALFFDEPAVAHPWANDPVGVRSWVVRRPGVRVF